MPENEEKIDYTVVIVDDDEGLNRLISKTLRREGFSVVSAYDGRSVVELPFFEKNFLLLLDFRLPDMTGEDIVKNLSEKNISVPFIIMTVYGDEQTAVRMMKLGARDYLVKDAGFIQFLPRVIHGALEKLDKEKRLAKAETRLRESEMRFREAFQISPDAITIVRMEDELLVEVNEGFKEVLGYSREEAVGRRVCDLAIWEDPSDAASFIETLNSGGTVSNRETRFRGKDGVVRTVLLSAGIMVLDNSPHILAIARDITRRKEIEEEIRQLNQELEKRVAERTAELHRSLETLKKTQNHMIQLEKMSALGSLVAGVAHEINTPVGIGVTGASFLEDLTHEISDVFKSGSLTKSALEKYVGNVAETTRSILVSLRRAADLIQSFKNIAVDQTSEVKRKFAVREYLDEMLLSLKNKLKKKDLDVIITCPEDLAVNSYPGALSQIVTNLVMNSLLHGFDGIEEGEIRFDISVNEDRLHLKYSDNGRGIPAEHLGQVFDPFFTTKRGQGGSGLGLHIIYNLVTQSLGGAIECESVEGKGTTFFIELPV